MATAARKQDLPPPGGYQNIPFARVPAKKYFSGLAMFVGYVAITTGAHYLYYLNREEVKRRRVEMRSASLALYPMLKAERDREVLKQIRRNRDEEASLMANVPGWVVGTWYGEPIYKTLPEDTWLEPTVQEYYVHASYKDYAQRVNFHLWT